MDFDNLKLITVNKETLLPIVLYGKNRSQLLNDWHKKVMVDYFGISFNYIECPFPFFSHGFCVNQVINYTIDSLMPDYYFFCDNDNIFLKSETLDIIYNSISNKIGIWSAATQSNHKKGPNGEINHPYASQASLAFSRDIFNKLNRPNLDHWSEQSDDYGGDTCERLTYSCEKAGYMVSLLYPSDSIEKNTNLGNGLRFGRGNTYGKNLMYHQMQNDNPLSEMEFVEKCKEVLNGKFKTRN